MPPHQHALGTQEWTQHARAGAACAVAHPLANWLALIMSSSYGSFRDFDSPQPQLRPQKRRLRQQRLLETALPCVLIIGVVVALFFTVGRIGVNARSTMQRMQVPDRLPGMKPADLSDQPLASLDAAGTTSSRKGSTPGVLNPR